MRVLTDQEKTELEAFATVEGRQWKDILMYEYWMKGIPVRDRKGRDYVTLYGLRNSHGPSWLEGVKL